MSQATKIKSKRSKRVDTSKVKAYKVAAVSDNYNDFGLRGVVIIARDGEAWEFAASDHALPTSFSTISLPVVATGDYFGLLGWEIPRKLPKCPKKVVKQVWGE